MTEVVNPPWPNSTNLIQFIKFNFLLRTIQDKVNHFEFKNRKQFRVWGLSRDLSLPIGLNQTMFHLIEIN